MSNLALNTDFVVDPGFVDREELRKILKNNILIVEFTKVNGEKRFMKCTLMGEHLPAIEATVKKTPHALNEEVVSVWDLDKAGWRSFRLDSINCIKYNVLSDSVKGK